MDPTIIELDKFDVAKHTKRYEEMWEVLKILIYPLPSLNVILSSHSPISRMGGKKTSMST
jgi:hypothetical protein